MCGGILGFHFYDLQEDLFGPGEILTTTFCQQWHTLPVKRACLFANSLGVGQLAKYLGLCLLDDLRSNLVLDREYVLEIAIIIFREKMPIGTRINQLRRDANPVAKLAH